MRLLSIHGIAVAATAALASANAASSPVTCPPPLPSAVCSVDDTSEATGRSALSTVAAATDAAAARAAAGVDAADVADATPAPDVVADAVDPAVVAESADPDAAAEEGNGVGRGCTFGREAARFADADCGRAADAAGRFSFSLDFDTFPLPCLSGQKLWQQARALSGDTPNR